MKIYIASLSDYNNGILHGRWIDLDGLDGSDVHAEIDEMLAESPTAKETGFPAEEWAIHDSEGFDCSEHEDLYELCEFVRLVGEHGEAFAIYCDNVGDRTDEDGFQDRYCGCFKDKEAYAYHIIEECYELESTMGNLACYFDYEKFARDLFIDGYYGIRGSEGLHVFHH